VSKLLCSRAGFEAVLPYFCVILITKKWETGTDPVGVEIPDSLANYVNLDIINS
jgi:hypothetical protein